MNRLDGILARIRAIKGERQSLTERLAAASAEAGKWRALAEMTLWAELESGASIRVDDTVRYALGAYRCILSHTKALTRRPTNPEFWTPVGE